METLANLPTPMPMPEKSQEDMLKERIASLECALALEKMRSRAFEKMIEITEAEEGISIIKKRWCQTVEALREEHPDVSAEVLCRLFREYILERDVPGL